jgi:hypothetical protein
MLPDELSKTILEFRDRYFRFFPKKATELGNHDYDDSLGKWNREGVRERITFLQHYHDLIKDSLEIDALILKNIIDSNLFHLKVVKPHTRPDFFVTYALDSIDRLIHLVEQTEDSESRAQVVDALVSRVNGFPVLFEQSREWLLHTTPVSRNLALYMVDFFQSFLENEYRSFIGSLDLDRAFREKLFGVIPFTIESLRRFAHFVRTLEVIPLNHPSLKRSKVFIKDLFRRKYSLEYNPQLLLEISRERVASLTREMQGIAGGDIAAYDEGMVERNRIPFSSNGFNAHLMAGFRERAERFFDFCRARDLIPTHRIPEITWTPIYRRKSSPLASYVPCGPYETLRNQGTLWVCPAEEPLSREAYREKRQLYHGQMMNSLVVHELIGHHLQFDHVREVEREAFRLSNNLTSDEGFALYAEETFTEEYTRELVDAQEAADMRFFQKKAELMRAHRVYVDVSLATGRLSLEEAVRYFSEKNGMPVETAQAECEKYYLNPGMASSYLVGKLELVGVRRYLEEKFGDGFSLPLFHEGLVNYGSIPIPLIKRSMLERLFRLENVIR